MTESPNPYHHGDLKRALIETAMAMLSEEQGWQFTLREVARRAGVSHAAPYRHFADRAALLTELADLGFKAFREALVAAKPATPVSLREQFLAMTRAYIQFAETNPNLYGLMFSADARLVVNNEMTGTAVASLEVLVNLLAEGQRDGWLKTRDVRVQAVGCWAQLHGLALLSINGILNLQNLGPNPVEAALAVILEGMEA